MSLIAPIQLFNVIALTPTTWQAMSSGGTVPKISLLVMSKLSSSRTQEAADSVVRSAGYESFHFTYLRSAHYNVLTKSSVACMKEKLPGEVPFLH